MKNKAEEYTLWVFLKEEWAKRTFLGKCITFPFFVVGSIMAFQWAIMDVIWEGTKKK